MVPSGLHERDDVALCRWRGPPCSGERKPRGKAESRDSVVDFPNSSPAQVRWWQAPCGVCVSAGNRRPLCWFFPHVWWQLPAPHGANARPLCCVHHGVALSMPPYVVDVRMPCDAWRVQSVLVRAVLLAQGDFSGAVRLVLAGGTSCCVCTVERSFRTAIVDCDLIAACRRWVPHSVSVTVHPQGYGDVNLIAKWRKVRRWGTLRLPCTAGACRLRRLWGRYKVCRASIAFRCCGIAAECRLAASTAADAEAAHPGSDCSRCFVAPPRIDSSKWHRVCDVVCL